jgi:hypothetical protein
MLGSGVSTDEKSAESVWRIADRGEADRAISRQISSALILFGGVNQLRIDLRQSQPEVNQPCPNVTVA